MSSKIKICCRDLQSMNVAFGLLKIDWRNSGYCNEIKRYKNWFGGGSLRLCINVQNGMCREKKESTALTLEEIKEIFPNMDVNKFMFYYIRRICR